MADKRLRGTTSVAAAACLEHAPCSPARIILLRDIPMTIHKGVGYNRCIYTHTEDIKTYLCILHDNIYKCASVCDAPVCFGEISSSL